jgi:ribosomal protein L18
MFVKNIKVRKVAKKSLKCRSKNGGAQYEINVQKTNLHVVATLYDCHEKRDLFTISTRGLVNDLLKTKTQKAFWIGEQFAKKCKEMNIERVSFNKLGYKFHGILSEVARGVTESNVLI